MTPFVVLSMPRSRSFWLSKFLSTPERPVNHDISHTFSSHDEIRDHFANPAAAVVDTALGLIWDRLHVQGVSIVLLHRDPDEVARSLRAAGMSMSIGSVYAYSAKLRSMRGFHVEQRDLDCEEGAKTVYRYCTGRKMPKGRWREFIGLNLQCDIATMELDVLANLAGIRAVFGAGAASCR